MSIENVVNFKKKLEGEKVVLVFPKPNYAETLMEIMNNPKVGPFMQYNWKNKTLEETKDWIKKINNRRKRGESLDYTILERKTEEPIGGCHLHRIDWFNKVAERGVWLGPQCWGKGYAKEATELLTSYAFNVLKLNKLILFVYSYNLRTKKQIERRGLKPESVEKRKYFVKGKPIDVIKYVLPKSKFKN